MKPISYRQEMENTEQICTPEPHKVLLSFNLGNSATMTVIISCQNGTASAWRIDSKLEVFLSSSPRSESYMIKISIPWSAILV